MKKALVVIDLQKDFVDGSLGTPEAVSIVPAAAAVIRSFDGDDILVTYDTHRPDYFDTLEGKKLPVLHCQEGTPGHELDSEIRLALEGKDFVEFSKNSFGNFEVGTYLKDKYPGEDLEIDIIGLCTDICVVSNALILRTYYPDAIIRIHAGCCAGVTPETHQAALATMSCCQIDIVD